MAISIQTGQQHLFGSSGIRSVFGKRLVDIALSLGLVCGRQNRSVMVGRDTRTSSELLKDILVSGLRAGGASVLDAGVLPTPTLALAARKVDLAIMVTASHNPPEYNGFKLIEPNGAGIGAAIQREIEDLIREDLCRPANWTDLGPLETYETAIQEHRETIARDCSLERKTKAVIDCCCGAACYITPMVLTGMGCEVIPLNCLPGGDPPRGAEPVETNLLGLVEATLEQGADVGIAHDVDADRMMIIDDRGRFVPGDKLLVILAQSMGFEEIVTTLDASMVLEELGFRVNRTSIGDIHVSRELMKSGSLGGEPSGSWVFPWVSLCPDGIYAAAKIAALASRRRLSELVDSIPEYPILRGNVGDQGICFDDMESALIQNGSVLDVIRTDGLKVVYDDGWILIRHSGTEPVMRLTIEARDEARLRTLYQHIMECFKSCGG